MYSRMIKGFGWAARGIWRCAREEWHFRFHLVIAFYVLLFVPYFSLSRAEGAILTLTIAGVLVAELVNSAVERTVDRVSTERHPLAGAAKDMAAGAVLLATIAAIAVAILLFWKPDVWAAIFADWGAHIHKPILLALSAVPAVLFVWKWRT
ncbi:MAG: diacylglycerol kinase family protein [Clostridia bacterium]|nr:diacylglycerol kinase family protein [Clostridia bacterium]